MKMTNDCRIERESLVVKSIYQREQRQFIITLWLTRAKWNPTWNWCEFLQLGPFFVCAQRKRSPQSTDHEMVSGDGRLWIIRKRRTIFGAITSRVVVVVMMTVFCTVKGVLPEKSLSIRFYSLIRSSSWSAARDHPNCAQEQKLIVIFVVVLDFVFGDGFVSVMRGQEVCHCSLKKTDTLLHSPVSNFTLASLPCLPSISP